MSKKIELKTTQPFTQADANQIATAISRLSELSDSKLVSPATDAERRGLREYLSDTLVLHGGELLGCWFTIRREYEPMLLHAAQFLHRVQSIVANKTQPQPDTSSVEEADPAKSAPPENVVTLNP